MARALQVTSSLAACSLTHTQPPFHLALNESTSLPVQLLTANLAKRNFLANSFPCLQKGTPVWTWMNSYLVSGGPMEASPADEPTTANASPPSRADLHLKNPILLCKREN